jgi:hypothetical protein
MSNHPTNSNLMEHAQKLVDRANWLMEHRQWQAAREQLACLQPMLQLDKHLQPRWDELCKRWERDAVAEIRQAWTDRRWDEGHHLATTLLPLLEPQSPWRLVLPRWMEDARVIRSAFKLSDLGRFAEAEQNVMVQQAVDVAFHMENPQASTIADEERWVGLAAALKDLRARQSGTLELLAPLRQAAQQGNWEQVLELSRNILTYAPKHPIAIQLKEQAHAELKALGKVPQPQEPAKLMVTVTHKHNGPSDNPATGVLESPGIHSSPPPRHRTLWIDGVGAFLLCDATEVVLGQAHPSSDVDIMVAGDISRRAIVFRRSGDEHLLQPLQPTKINGITIDRATLLKDRDLIQIGDRVQLGYYRPSPLSGTARLELVSRHRWHQSIDGVLLLGDSCVLGPSATSHILCPYWSKEVLLFRHRQQWMCRTGQPLEIDGKSSESPIVVEPGKRILGQDFSMTLD